MLKVGRWLIYGLIDPRDRTFFYIGKTHRRREIRLAEHIDQAVLGAKMGRHIIIRDLLAEGKAPEIFVVRKVQAIEDWRQAERDEIRRWSEIDELSLPLLHPAQTRLSLDIEIRSIRLTN